MPNPLHLLLPLAEGGTTLRLLRAGDLETTFKGEPCTELVYGRSLSRAPASSLHSGAS